MPSPRRAAAIAATGLAAAHLVPSVAAIGPLRRAVLPRLSGFAPAPRGTRGAGHVALTFDDGPDRASTPLFLDELARLEVHATFFLLGARLAAAPEVARRIAAEGHEVAVHGWSHTPHLLRLPRATAADIRRARAALAQATGVPPRYWRPPHGIPTGAGLAAARRLGLTPVLWTVDGRDWQAAATPDTVSARVRSGLRAGAVVLLHDSDVTSAPGSWRSTLGALPAIVDACRQRSLDIGPLRAHYEV